LYDKIKIKIKIKKKNEMRKAETRFFFYLTPNVGILIITHEKSWGVNVINMAFFFPAIIESKLVSINLRYGILL
jgi:hypothetical protein